MATDSERYLGVWLDKFSNFTIPITMTASISYKMDMQLPLPRYIQWDICVLVESIDVKP